MGDPNPEQEAEPAPDTVDTIVLSLCGGLADSRDISLGMSNREPFQGLAPSPEAGESGRTPEGGAAEG